MATRVLHVVGGMNQGGVETWLMHVLRSCDREEFQLDFLVHTTQPCAHDDEIRALGSRIIPCLEPSRPFAYAYNFRRILRECGPYDVVHSHVHHYSGYVLALAQRAGVPVRIAHSHSDTSGPEATVGMLRQLYLSLMRWSIRRHAVTGLAASRRAASALYGSRWESDPRYSILYYGIDLGAFRGCPNPEAVRAEVGLPSDAFVIGHVGSFREVKNHAFLVDVAGAVKRREPLARFLLVGDGPLRKATELRVVQAGLGDSVVFAGLRRDVPRLMLGAMDVFVMPSLYEGLPLVLIEAQAAGLPCVLSSSITEEADVVKPLMRRLPLSQPATTWADSLLGLKGLRATAVSRRQALESVERSGFGILASANALRDLYARRLPA